MAIESVPLAQQTNNQTKTLKKNQNQKNSNNTRALKLMRRLVFEPVSSVTLQSNLLFEKCESRSAIKDPLRGFYKSTWRQARRYQTRDWL